MRCTAVRWWCREDYLAGKRYPLELVTTDPSIYRGR